LYLYIGDRKFVLSNIKVTGGILCLTVLQSVSKTPSMSACLLFYYTFGLFVAICPYYNGAEHVFNQILTVYLSE